MPSAALEKQGNCLTFTVVYLTCETTSHVLPGLRVGQSFKLEDGQRRLSP